MAILAHSRCPSTICHFLIIVQHMWSHKSRLGEQCRWIKNGRTWNRLQKRQSVNEHDRFDNHLIRKSAFDIIWLLLLSLLLSVCLLIMNWTMLPVINSHYLGIAGDNSTLGTMSFNLLSQRNKSNSELSKTYWGESEIYFGNSKIYNIHCTLYWKVSGCFYYSTLEKKCTPTNLSSLKIKLLHQANNSLHMFLISINSMVTGWSHS